MSKMNLSEAEKKARNEYLKEWLKRPENKEKRKQYAKNYWAKKVQAMKDGIEN